MGPQGLRGPVGPQGPAGPGITDEQVQLLDAFLTGNTASLTQAQIESLRTLMLRIFEGSGTVLDSEYQASVARRNTELERRLQALEGRPGATGNAGGTATATGATGVTEVTGATGVTESEYQQALEEVTRLQEQLQELAARLAALGDQ